MRGLVDRLLRATFPSRVTFDDGSYIEPQHREAIRYAETNGHQMEIMWYFQEGRLRGRVLYAPDIESWDPPHEAEPLSAEKKAEIKRKLIAYSEERRIPLRIENVRPNT